MAALHWLPVPRGHRPGHCRLADQRRLASGADRLDRVRGSKVAKVLGENAWFIAMDVADEGQVALGVAEVLGQFGRLDALVCNAAVADPHNITLESLDLAYWNRVLAVNLSGPMLLAKHCAPYCARTAGRSSIWPRPARGSRSRYRGLRGEQGRVVGADPCAGDQPWAGDSRQCGQPGWIDARDPSVRRAEPLTDADHAQHPAGRVGTVEDVAAMVAWLLSRNAGFVTGQEFVVDGGMTKKMIYE
jgi:NAD(P)-dependent dehydrogenase (short-subunit alcohol dehydrogenase family)